jgi:hypothetical protein
VKSEHSINSELSYEKDNILIEDELNNLIPISQHVSVLNVLILEIKLCVCHETFE